MVRRSSFDVRYLLCFVCSLVSDGCCSLFGVWCFVVYVPYLMFVVC